MCKKLFFYVISRLLNYFITIIIYLFDSKIANTQHVVSAVNVCQSIFTKSIVLVCFFASTRFSTYIFKTKTDGGHRYIDLIFVGI